MKLNILYEDRLIIAVEKERGIPVQSDKSEDKDLMQYVKDYLREKVGHDKSYLGLIHRIDRPVGGVVVFAKNKFAASSLSEQIRLKKVDKEYMAVVCGIPDEKEKVLEDYVKKLSTINMSKISSKDNKNAKLAKMKYTLINTVNTEEYGNLSLIKVKLYTGRHHQIRVQLSNCGLPIWGDNKYNKTFVKKKEFTNTSLWSTKYVFCNPKTNDEISISYKPDVNYPLNLFM